MKLFIFTTFAILVGVSFIGCSAVSGTRTAKPAACCCSEAGCKHDGKCNCPSHEKCPSCESECDCAEKKGCGGAGDRCCGK